MKPTSFEQLETAYEAIALAIDRVGPENEALFLSKLALALAHRLNDERIVAECIEIALKDIDVSG